MLPRAYFFFGLNAVRAFSIIALLLVFCSGIFVMVKDVEAFNAFQNAKQSGNFTTDMLLNCDYIDESTVPNQPAGIFWAVVNRLLIIFQVIVLLLSEFEWPSSFFERFFPVLGPNFGLGPLGIFQCLIGATILSHHVDDFTLVAAFFLFAVGCLNILLGLIFRESAKDKRSITAWRSESKGVLPSVRDIRPQITRVSSSFIQSEKASSDFGGRTPTAANLGYGFGRQGEKAAGLKGFLISKPLETLPRYASRPISASEYSQPSPTATHTSAPAFQSSATAI